MNRHPIQGILVVRVVAPEDWKADAIFYTGRMYGPRFNSELCFIKPSLIKAPVEQLGATVVCWTHTLNSLDLDDVLYVARDVLSPPERWHYRPWADEMHIYWLPDKWRMV